MGILSILKKKRVKDVATWRGDAADYSTPQSYANASLINFNNLVGRKKPEWTKDLIALPIREEGDSSDTFVKQAVQAACEGIIRIRKPEGISQEDFDRTIKTAANELIRAYELWDSLAPDSIYLLAGKSPSKERSIGMQDVFSRVGDAVFLADMAEDTFTYMIDIYYDDIENRFFALGLREGRLYKMNIIANSDEVLLGEFEEVPLTESLTTARGKNELTVFRDAQGRKRFLAIANVATLNRVNEIDSTRLFDSFITYTEITKRFPILNIYHLGEESRIGKADFLARDGFVYIASGYFDNNKFGDAVYDTLEREGGKWGNSIEFLSLESSIENVSINGVSFQTRVHNVGINTGISILLEQDAASILTTHQSIKRGEGVVMDKQREKLLDLFGGNEALIDEFLTKVRQANDIAMTRISRSVDSDTEEAQIEVDTEEVATEGQEQEEVAEEIETEAEEATTEDVVNVELGETFVNDLVRSVEFNDALTQLLNERLAKLEQRLGQIEQRQVENEAWVEDIPAAVRTNRRAVVSYRAKGQATVATEDNKSYEQRAKETLDNIFGD